LGARTVKVTTSATSRTRDISDDEDRTARARIRDAAIVRFANEGVSGASLKAIAEDVGVSAPLVIHHYGSKEGLRVACDEYVAAVIRERKREVFAGGGQMDPLQALREAGEGPPLMKYLTRTLADGSPHVAELIDEMVDDAVGYMAEAVDRGMLKPSSRPRERAIVLVIWQLGALVLHEHVERLLGVDITDPEGPVAWALPATEILAEGVFTPEYAEQWQAAMESLPREES
jgi:AcrR family transcriptional regulator